MKPTIVIMTYDRAKSFQRLLTSLNRATIPSGVDLIISIDYNQNQEVYQFAKGYHWHYGQKEIISHPRQLRTRQHLFFCGDLTQQRGDIIILEDDLYVSPNFYIFAEQALNYYREVPTIAGIGLYAHQYNETAKMHFIPMQAEFDTFFLRLPCSWGQCWTPNQWKNFSNWLTAFGENTDFPLPLPYDVQLWPDTSWKKIFLQYLIITEKYFVYPYYSYTVNFMDPGVNHIDGNMNLLIPLNLTKKTPVFAPLDSLSVCYDEYCEIMPQFISHRLPTYAQNDFSVDLYGVKSRAVLDGKYVFTSKMVRHREKGFKFSFRPHELNILLDQPGDDFFFAAKENVLEDNNFIGPRRVGFYYGVPMFILRGLYANNPPHEIQFQNWQTLPPCF